MTNISGITALAASIMTLTSSASSAAASSNEIQNWMINNAVCIGQEQSPVRNTEGLIVQLDPANETSKINAQDLTPNGRTQKVLTLDPINVNDNPIEGLTIINKGSSVYLVKKITANQTVQRNGDFLIREPVCPIGDNLLISLQLAPEQMPVVDRIHLTKAQWEKEMGNNTQPKKHISKKKFKKRKHKKAPQQKG